MATSEFEETLQKLRLWCDAEHGRQAEIARALDVSRGTITHWLIGRRTPALRHWLALRVFLRHRR